MIVELENEIAEILLRVEDGDKNALEALAEFRVLAKLLTAAASQIEPLAFEEAGKYGEKSFSDMGFSFEVKNGARQYDYKGVPEWVTKKAELVAIETNAKAAAASALNNIANVDELTGEVLPAAVITFKKDSIAVKELNPNARKKGE